MQIKMLKEYDAINTISVISMYCSVYRIPISEIEIPSVRTKISGVKILAILQEIQSRWLEAATGRDWTADEFIGLCVHVATWIEESSEFCDNDAMWEYWWACQWKKAAETILGLNVKGDSQS